MPEFADWERNFVMVGDSPVGWKAVLLAEDGSMYALLQGETAAGVQQTVRLDSEGRLSAFIIDSTDAWNRMLTIGNAELAVRLGSSARYDRRGQVVFLEDFEHGWGRWRSYLSGSDAAAALTPETSSHGGYCAKLTGGKSTGWYSFLRFTRGVLPVGQVGVEMSFALPSAVDFVLLGLYFHTMTKSYMAKAYFVDGTHKLQVYDAVAIDMVDVGTAKQAEESMHVFNTMKLVVDLNEEKYMRLLFNQQEIDVSDYVPDVGGFLYPNRMTLDIGVYSRNNFNDVMYLDDVIFTMAEPE